MKTIFSLFLVFLLLISFANITYAKGPKYVGFEENEEFIWKYTIEDDDYEDMLDDFDMDPPWDDDYPDYEGRKIIVKDIKKKMDGWAEIEIKTYFTEKFDQNKWKKESDYDEIDMFEFDEELYAPGVVHGVFNDVCAFIPTDTDWEDLEDAVRDLDDLFYIDDIDAKALNNGINVTVEWGEDGFVPDSEIWEDVEETDLSYRFNDKGVCIYFEIKYDGEQVLLAELQEVIPGYQPYILIGALAITILGIIYTYKKKYN